MAREQIDITNKKVNIKSHIKFHIKFQIIVVLERM